MAVSNKPRCILNMVSRRKLRLQEGFHGKHQLGKKDRGNQHVNPVPALAELPAMNVFIIIGAVILSFLVYLNSLSAEFVYDDSRAIVQNQDLRPETPWCNLLYNDFWGTPLTDSGSHKSYRPVCTFTFRLNYLMGGLEPFGYHLLNILLHSICTGLFTGLAHILLRSNQAAFVAGCVFAVHPVHTEAVAGIVGRADVLACAFYLLAWISYIYYCDSRDCPESHANGRHHRFVYLGLTMTCALLSMLSKEHGIMVIGMCILYDCIIQAKQQLSNITSNSIRKVTSLYSSEGILFLLLWGCFILFARIFLMGYEPPTFSPSDNPAANSESLITRILTFLYLPAFNFWILVFPLNLSFDWSMEAIPLIRSPLDYRNPITITFYVSFFIIVVTSLKNSFNPYVQTLFGSSFYDAKKVNNQPYHLKNENCRLQKGHSSAQKALHPKSNKQPDLFGNQEEDTSHSLGDMSIVSLCALVFPFIPASNLLFYVGFVIAERVLYIPSLGFALLIGHLYIYLSEKLKEEKVRTFILWGTFSLYITMFSIRTIVRNRDWQTEESLYMSGIHVNPAKAWGNLGNIYSAKGLKPEAERAYQEALNHRGNMADVHYNLGILYQEQGRHQEALVEYARAVQCRPRLTVAYLNIGIIKALQGDYDAAEQNYKVCSDMDISGLKDPKLHKTAKISALYNWAKMKADLTKHDEAIPIFLEAIKKKPEYYASHSLYNMLGESYLAVGRDSDAEKWYKKSLAVKPDHFPAFLTMAKIMHKKNRDKEAEAFLKRAVREHPNDYMGYQHYALFLADTKRFKEAIAMTEKALTLKPKNFDLVFAAANIYREAELNEQALKYYEKAVALSPLDPVANMNLGAMYHKTHNYEKAEKSYLATLKLKPGDKPTQDNLERLRKVKVRLNNTKN